MGFRLVLLPAVCLALAAAGTASADPVAWHAEGGSARAVGNWQGYEYGSGSTGSVAVEVPFNRIVGAQLEAGGLWLPHVNPPQDAAIVGGGDGSALSLMVGMRFHPFGAYAGAWIDGNVGYLRSGPDNRYGFDAHVGYDFRVDEGRLDVGPYLGYLQVVEPLSSLRPDDAHIVTIGLHVAVGRERPRVFLAKAQPPKAPPATIASLPVAPRDRDEDGVVDESDACPATPGVSSGDPSTNGCPSQEDVRVVDNHIEYSGVIHFETGSPKVDLASWPPLANLSRFIMNNADIGKVEIEGHADERGSDAYNLLLSRARARSVRALLVKFGTDPARLSAEAFGESKPRSQGHTEDDWRQNRRVEFVITRAARATQTGATALSVEEKQR